MFKTAGRQNATPRGSDLDRGPMRPRSVKYVVITPVRDEEKHLAQTLESMVRQTVRPSEYVVVNDGSKDRTGEIIERYARQYPWIRAIHRRDRGFRKTGGGIIEAFYDGYNALRCEDWEFVSKLDGDLSFEPDYFAGCFDRFQEDPRLGIGGGFLYHMVKGKPVLEDAPDFHVRGGVKIYRRQCWEALGGLWVGPNTDLVDEIKAIMLGWKTRGFRDLLLHHHRPTGAAYGIWGGPMKDGRGDYVCGYHPLFLIAKYLSRMIRKPYVVGSLGMLYGFVDAYFRRIPRVDDPELIRFVRQQQINRLLGRETIWR